MQIIIPTIITDAILTSSTVPETDYAAWNNATAYVVGNRCIMTSTHKIYECLVNNTNFQPDQNTGGTTPKWLEVSATNRWKVFDSKLADQTSNAASIGYVLTPGIISAISFFNVDANTVEVEMVYDSVTVYSKTIELISTTNVIDGYTYFFNPFLMKTELTLIDLPPYAGTLTITISKIAGTAKIGEIVLGQTQSLGLTELNPSITIQSYSRKDVDTFGNYIIVQRAYSSRMSCDMWIASEIVDEIKRLLVLYRDTPVVWIGSDTADKTVLYNAMVIYGFYKSFNIVIQDYNNSACSLEIEGLT